MPGFRIWGLRFRGLGVFGFRVYRGWVSELMTEDVLRGKTLSIEAPMLGV